MKKRKPIFTFLLSFLLIVSNASITFSKEINFPEERLIPKDAESSDPAYALNPPHIVKISAVKNGIEILWNAIENAYAYRIFYRTDQEEDWTPLADTNGTDYTWENAIPGTDYSFTICCLDADGQPASEMNQEVSAFRYLDNPRISDILAGSDGLTIKWTPVPGASRYRVYYQSGKSWIRIAETTSAAYTWNNGTIGKNYTFTVRCLSEDGRVFASYYDQKGTDCQFYRMATPQIDNVKNTANGISITWTPVPGAEKYHLCYKIDNGSWKRVVNTTDCGYTWKNAVSGTAYTFTVRCISTNGKAYTSGYNKAGVSICRLSQPVISNMKVTDSGVRIEWTPVPGASYYRVYYNKKDVGWTRLRETASTNCVIHAYYNKSYHYTVRAFCDSASSSYQSPGPAIMRIATPKAPAVNETAAGIQLLWQPVANAEKYRVFYQIGKNVWKKIADTSSTSYTWKNAKPGTKYTFTIRCLSGDGKYFTSSYNTTGTSITTARYQNPLQYYQIRDSIQLSGGGYDLSLNYEGLKVAWVIKRLGIHGGSYVGMGYGKCVYTYEVMNAVKNFQKQHGLAATGIVNLSTWKAMGYSESSWDSLGAYVSPLKVSKSSTRSEHIEAMIERAYEYLGTPYVVGASGSPGTGVDCSGLVMQALYAAGIDLSPINPVRHAKPGYEYESRYMWNSSKFKHVSYSNRQRGDLIFYQNSAGIVIHVAIYLGNDLVIESWPDKVVVWPVKNSSRSNIKGVVRPFV